MTRVAAVLLVVLALVTLWVASRRPSNRLPSECAAAYQRARTASDTAIVDALQPNRREASPPTCGERRRAIAGGK